MRRATTPMVENVLEEPGPSNLPRSILKKVKNIPFGAKGRKRLAIPNISWHQSIDVVAPNEPTSGNELDIPTNETAESACNEESNLIEFSDDEQPNANEAAIEINENEFHQKVQQDFAEFIGGIIEKKRVPNLLPISSLLKPKSYGRTKMPVSAITIAPPKERDVDDQHLLSAEANQSAVENLTIDFSGDSAMGQMLYN